MVDARGETSRKVYKFSVSSLFAAATFSNLKYNGDVSDAVTRLITFQLLPQNEMFPEAWYETRDVVV